MRAAIHRGGAIVPGPDLMLESLLEGYERHSRARSRQGRGRQAVRAQYPRGPRAGGALFGRVYSGTRGGRSARDARKAAGGHIDRRAAPAVRRLLRVRHRLVPDLVLRGLTHLV